MFKSVGLPEIGIIIAGIVVIALLVWAIIWIVSMIKGKKSSKETNNALEIARQRYAKGEITKEQFEQLKKDLS